MKTHSRSVAFKWLFGLLMLVLISANSFAGDISVIDAYARAVPAGQPNSAAFMILENSGAEDRALVGALSSVSKVVELHTHLKEGGMMRMRRVDKIEIKAGSKTVLKPGGLHVMFIGLNKALTQGDKVDLALIFDDGNQIRLKLPVKMVAGMQPKKPMH